MFCCTTGTEVPETRKTTNNRKKTATTNATKTKTKTKTKATTEAETETVAATTRTTARATATNKLLKANLKGFQFYCPFLHYVRLKL